MLKKIILCFLLTLLFINIIHDNSIIKAEEYRLSYDEPYYPLVVYGGEPEGVMAAVAAAREGLDTLLIMERERPGGLITYGALNYLDINYGPDGRSLNRGLFNEWHLLIDDKVTFPLEEAFTAFEKMIYNEEKIIVYDSCELKQVLKDKEKDIKALRIKDAESQEFTVCADFFIDATQDAKLAVAAGVPYYKGGEDIGLSDRHMAVTLVMHFGNINWKGLASEVQNNSFGPSWITREHAWGFVKIGDLYKPRNSNIRLRGLNIVYDNSAGSDEVYINSMLIFNTDPEDINSLNQAYKQGVEETPYILDFLRENVRGFENAVLMDYPPELYVRESRHIKAKYQLRVNDLFNNRIPVDTVALASYPLDYQASEPEYRGFVLFNPDIYGVPLCSLIPQNINNMLVVGRSSGYSSLAAASARVLPTGMSTGEAAGIVTALCFKEGLEFLEIAEDVEKMAILQKKVNIHNLIKRNEDYT
ncbi:MAG TPA: FAD-dependent oxidoreductase, partial [Halanaerobiales bacterium]|nr:FAD-dependent oxidoreductase [Halanaerobiales bacterium]